MTSPLHHGAVVWGLCEPRLLTMAIVKDQSTSQQNLKMLETSRVEIDELPASIPWIVLDKARVVVELFHTRSVASQFHVTHTLTRKVTDVCISNGMAWSPGNTKMYHMDSGLRKLWSFNFDDVRSCLTNRQVCWWTSTTRGWGIPDAMCTDSEGRLWRAGLFGATIVLKAPPIAPPTMAGTSLGLQLISQLKSGEEESSSSSSENDESSDEEDEPIPLVPV
eukprot:Em0002g386a